MKLPQNKTILFIEYTSSDARKGQEKNIESRVKEAGYRMVKVRPKGDMAKYVEEWAKENGEKPCATLRWDEHGGLYGSKEWCKVLSKWGYKNKVAPLSVDFSYFNHYKGQMFDLLQQNGEPSIKKVWVELEQGLIEYKDMSGKMGEYIKLIQSTYKKHRYIKQLDHLKPKYKFVAFTQSLMNRCRLMKKNLPYEWMTNLKDILDDEIIFKAQPAAFVKKNETVEDFNIIRHANGKGKYLKTENAGMEQNASLAVNSCACIINTAGVSSEFVIGEIPVIATGTSWFHGLNIFHEPNSWEELKKIALNENIYQLDEAQKFNRLKWVNWWMRRQVLEKEPSNVIKNLINEFMEKN